MSQRISSFCWSWSFLSFYPRKICVFHFLLGSDGKKSKRFQRVAIAEGNRIEQENRLGEKRKIVLSGASGWYCACAEHTYPPTFTHSMNTNVMLPLYSINSTFDKWKESGIYSPTHKLHSLISLKWVHLCLFDDAQSKVDNTRWVCVERFLPHIHA